MDSHYINFKKSYTIVLSFRRFCIKKKEKLWTASINLFSLILRNLILENLNNNPLKSRFGSIINSDKANTATNRRNFARTPYQPLVKNTSFHFGTFFRSSQFSGQFLPPLVFVSRVYSFTVHG